MPRTLGLRGFRPAAQKCSTRWGGNRQVCDRHVEAEQSATRSRRGGDRGGWSSGNAAAHRPVGSTGAPHPDDSSSPTDVERPVKAAVFPGGGHCLRACEQRVLVVQRRLWRAACGGRLQGWWRPSSPAGTTHRGGMDRQAATLMYAGRDRRSAIRRKGPLTSIVSGRTGGHSSDGDRSCDGGAPARRDDDGSFLADQHGSGRVVSAQAAISAHRNPASSRAMAAAAMLVEGLLAARRRNRPHSRSWAAHARATT